MTLSEQQQAFSKDVAKLIAFFFFSGDACTLGEAWRPPETAELYEAQGRGIKNSQHCKRLAIDLNLFRNGKYITDTESYRPYGEYWESLDPMNRWGGRFRDGNHFERRGG